MLKAIRNTIDFIIFCIIPAGLTLIALIAVMTRAWR